MAPMLQVGWKESAMQEHNPSIYGTLPRESRCGFWEKPCLGCVHSALTAKSSRRLVPRVPFCAGIWTVASCWKMALARKLEVCIKCDLALTERGSLQHAPTKPCGF